LCPQEEEEEEEEDLFRKSQGGKICQLQFKRGTGKKKILFGEPFSSRSLFLLPHLHQL
jgi:hypothetical protein